MYGALSHTEVGRSGYPAIGYWRKTGGEATSSVQSLDLTKTKACRWPGRAYRFAVSRSAQILCNVPWRILLLRCCRGVPRSLGGPEADAKPGRARAAQPLVVTLAGP